jgi:hypothetical protein
VPLQLLVLLPVERLAALVLLLRRLAALVLLLRRLTALVLLLRRLTALVLLLRRLAALPLPSFRALLRLGLFWVRCQQLVRKAMEAEMAAEMERQLLEKRP